MEVNQNPSKTRFVGMNLRTKEWHGRGDRFAGALSGTEPWPICTKPLLHSENGWRGFLKCAIYRPLEGWGALRHL